MAFLRIAMPLNPYYLGMISAQRFCAYREENRRPLCANEVLRV
jgi:hypothetical protein